jgi:phytanoyl-CoA hydroxylase
MNASVQPQQKSSEIIDFLTPQQVALYRRNGFVNAGQVIADAEVTRLQEELARVLRDRVQTELPQPYRLANFTGDEAHPLWQIVNIWQASEAFLDLLFNPRIITAVQQATGAAGLRLWHDQIQYKTAGGGGVNPWHQDNPYWAPIAPADTQITAWLALDDVEDDNGCMSMVPGSHAWGDAIEHLHTVKDYDALPEHYQGHVVHVVRTPVRAGCLHLHHPYTWHGSHVNRSGRPRRAIALHFMTDQVSLVAGKKFQHILGKTITSEPGEPLEGPLFVPVYPQAVRPQLMAVMGYRD